MIDLTQIKERWEKEKPLYDELGDYVKIILEKEVQKDGNFVEVKFRSKDLDTLLKKMFRKQCSYDEITDKLGIRAILYFRKQLPSVDHIIQSVFIVYKREDKSEDLGVDRWGYQGIHFDVELPESLYVHNEKFKGIVFEIQLQTHCQNVWCELNHALYYKSEIEMPTENIRSINRLSALLETADVEFERTHTMISDLPTYKEVKLLQMLERHYYTFVAKPYDRELSLDILSKLCASFKNLDVENYQSRMATLIQTNRSMLKQVYQDYISTPDRSILLFQPEGLLMLLLMDEDLFQLKSSWIESYSPDELERLANIFGKTID